MEIFVARQPIFDRGQNVIGYELLFRRPPEEVFPPATDGTAATAQVINNTFFSMDLERMAGGRKTFLNFTRELLLNGSASLLPPATTVIEVLETVAPDTAVIDACARLKEQGFGIALDDFVDAPCWEPLVGMADFIKVDLLSTSPEQQALLAQKYGPRGVTMIAEKVESREDFERVKALGYCFFQGYFFARPSIVRGREIPGSKVNHLRLLQAINQTGWTPRQVEELVRLDVSLSYKLLRYANSASVGARQPVTSISRALMLLGETEFRKWVSLAALLTMAEERPRELIVRTLARARFLELLEQPLRLAGRGADLFLLGLFSLLDVMLNRTMEEAIQGILLAPDVSETLLAKSDSKSPLSQAFGLIRAYETADWQSFTAAMRELGLSEEALPKLYLDSICWAEQIFALK